PRDAPTEGPSTRSRPLGSLAVDAIEQVLPLRELHARRAFLRRLVLALLDLLPVGEGDDAHLPLGEQGVDLLARAGLRGLGQRVQQAIDHLEAVSAVRRDDAARPALGPA